MATALIATRCWSRFRKETDDMQRIVSLTDTRAQEFRTNDVHNRRLAAELKERQEAARFARPERDLERLRRQKKMFVRDRIPAPRSWSCGPLQATRPTTTKCPVPPKWLVSALSPDAKSSFTLMTPA